MSDTYRAAIVAVGAAALACSTNVPIPDGAQLTCAGPSDCPTGLVCHTGRCEQPSQLDTTPPDLAGAPLVSPAVARAGVTLAIDLQASETLAEPPEVALALVPPVAAPCLSTGGRTYRCTYVTTGAEHGGLGGVVPFDVRLRDRARNETTRGRAGAIVLDYTPPALAARNVAPDPAPLDGVIQVFFTSSEPLASAPVLVASAPLDDGAGGRTRFPLDVQPGTLNYGFAHLVTANDPAGPVELTVELVDPSGNATVVRVGGLVIDNQPPEITAVTVTPERVGAAGIVTATVAISDPAASLGVSLASPRRPLTCAPVTAVSHTCTYAVQADEVAAGTEAPLTLLFELVDPAGNRAPGVSRTVVFDRDPPHLVAASVAYVPAATNPLPSVARATAGTVVRVAALASEPVAVAVPPTLVARLGSATIGFALAPAGVAGGSVTFEGVVPDGAPDGVFEPELAWTDLQGNGAIVRFAAPAIEVKTSQPALHVNQAEVTFLRSPWGNAAAEDRGGFVIPAGPYFALAPPDPLSAVSTLAPGTFTLAAGALAAVRVWSDSSRRALLGTVRPLPGGTWPRARLEPIDVPAAWVTGVDDAGNESTPVKIAAAEWVATANSGVGGASPHVVDVSTYANESLVPSPDSVYPSAPNHGAISLGGLDEQRVVAAGQVAIQRVGFQQKPAPRSGAAMAYDSARGRVVVFGGRNAYSGHTGDTWEWDGRMWLNRTPPSGSPSVREGAAMAYDAARGRVVLMGGGAGTAIDPDTYEWDGERWERVAAGGSPGARQDHAMVYDPVRRRVVLFGGSSGDARTWEWDGATWSPDDPTTPQPPGNPPVRSRAGMAFDGARGHVVLFGGTSGAPLGDLWERIEGVWTTVAQAGDVPGPRAEHALAYDPVRQRVVLFGGLDAGSVAQRDVREWDGASWSDLTSGSPGIPAARSRHGLVYDLDRGAMLLLGGATDGQPNLPRDDLWSWRNGKWADRTLTTGTFPRERYAIAYDEARRRTVLFGGLRRTDPPQPLQDVWEWDGVRWVVATPVGGPSPYAPSGAAMTYDPDAGRVVVLGEGAGGTEVWEWTGSGWTQRPTAGGTPPARIGASLTYDRVRHALVLFGGVGLNDTWVLTGPLAGTWTWTQRANPPPAGLTPRSDAAAIFDGARTLLAFGSGPAEVWQWDGDAWTSVTPASMPASGIRAMAWDSVRKRAVVSGVAPGDVWEWTGAGFVEAQQPTFVTWPGAVPTQAMVFDSARRRTVLFEPTTNTWEWDADLVGSPAVQKRAPMVQLTASLARAGFDATSAVALRVRARAGGSAGSGGEGAQLLGWKTGGSQVSTGEWAFLDASGEGVSAPPVGVMTWTAPAGEVQSYILGRDGTLGFQLRPLGAPGPTEPEATLAADYLEVRIRYAAP